MIWHLESDYYTTVMNTSKIIKLEGTMNTKSDKITNLLEKFISLLEEVVNFYKMFHFKNESISVPMKDMENFIALKDDERNYQDVSSMLDEKLVHYKNLLAVMNAKYSTDVENEIEDVINYFNDIPAKYVLMMLVDTGEFTVNAVNIVNQIELIQKECNQDGVEQNIVKLSSREKLLARVNELKGITPNAFEEAIIASHYDGVMYYLNDERALESMGYSEIEIMGINYSLSSLNPEMLNSNFVGSTLYFIQGNKNFLAEKYLIENVVYKNDVIALEGLMKLYELEKNWNGIIDAYDCANKTEVYDISLRALYVKALIYTNNEDLQHHIEEKFVDFIAYVNNESNRNKINFEFIKNQLAEAVRINLLTEDFFKHLMKVIDYVSIPLYRSIFLYDDKLRERISDDKYLLKMGFSERQIKHLQDKYYSNEYNRESNLIGTIDRVMDFIGYRDEIVVTLGKLCLNSGVETKYDDYSAKVLFLLAALNTGDEIVISADVPVLNAKVDPKYIENLLEEYAKEENIDFISEFLVKNFDRFLSWYWNMELVKILGSVNIGGNGLNEYLKHIQTNAYKAGNMELVMYLLFNFHLSEEYIGLVSVFLKDCANKLQQLSEKEQVAYNERLNKITAGNESHTYSDIEALSFIRNCLIHSSDSHLAKRTIANFLRTVVVTKDELVLIYKLLIKHYDYMDSNVCGAIWEVTKTLGMHLQGVEFFKCLLQSNALTEKYAIEDCLFNIYLDGLKNNWLTSDCYEEVYKLCHKMISKRSGEAFLCLFYLYERMGNQSYADIAFYIITNKNLLKSDEYKKEINTIASLYNYDINQNFFNCFKAILKRSTVDEVKELMVYINRLYSVYSNINNSSSINTAVHYAPEEILEYFKSGDYEYFYSIVLEDICNDIENSNLWNLVCEIVWEEAKRAYLNKQVIEDYIYKLAQLISQCDKQKADFYVDFCEMSYEANSGNREEEYLISAYDMAIMIPSCAERLLNFIKTKKEISSTGFVRSYEIITKNKELLVNSYGEKIFIQAIANSLCNYSREYDDNNNLWNTFVKDYSEYITEKNVDFFVMLSFTTCYRNEHSIPYMYEFISKMSRKMYISKYQEFLTQFRDYDLADFKKWLAVDKNIILCRLIVSTIIENNFTGNRTEFKRDEFIDIVLKSIKNKKDHSLAEALISFIEIYPEDYFAVYLLFIVASQQFYGYKFYLYKALKILATMSEDIDKHRRYQYSRYNRSDFVLMIGVLEEVFKAQNYSEHIENIFDYAKDLLNEDEFERLNNEIYIVKEQLIEAKGTKKLNVICEGYLANITSNWDTIIKKGIEDTIYFNGINCVLSSNRSRNGFLRSCLNSISRFGENFRVTLSDDYKLTEPCVLNKFKFGEFALLGNLIDDIFLNTIRVSNVNIKELRLGISSFLSSGVPEDLLRECLYIPMEEPIFFNYVSCMDLIPKHPTNINNGDIVIRLVMALCNHQAAFEFISYIGESNYESYNYDDARYLLEAVAPNLQYQLTNSKKGLYWGELWENENIMMKISNNEKLLLLCTACSEETDVVFNNEAFNGSSKEPIYCLLNAVIHLLRGHRFKEIFKLKQFVNEYGCKIIDTIFLVLDYDIEDKVKVEVINKLTYSYRVIFYEFMNINIDNIFKDIENIQEIKVMNDEFRLTSNASSFSYRIDDVPLEKESIELLKSSKTKIVQAFNIPSVFEDIVGAYNRTKSYEEIGDEDYLAEILSKEYSPELKYVAILNHIIWAYKNKRDLNNILKQTFNLPDINHILIRKNTIYGEVKDILISKAFSELCKSHSSIEMFCRDFYENNLSYLNMKDIIANEDNKSLIECLYTNLNQLGKYYAKDVSFKDEKEVKIAIGDALEQIEDIDSDDWQGIKNHFYGLLKSERNKLNSVPRLEISVFNKDIQIKYSCLYGMVKNIGQRMAKDVNLQAIFDNDIFSSIYHIEEIAPGKVVYFKIPFSDDISVGEVKYKLELDYCFNNSREYCTPTKGKLDIFERKTIKTPKVAPYQLQNSSFSYDKETQTVKNKDFFGCNEQKLKLQSLILGESFEEYRSALIYGERRSGKTLLLKYFEALVGGSLPNVVCISTSGHGSSNTSIQETSIQEVFIKKVLDSLVNKSIVNTQDIQWQTFEKEWLNTDKDRGPSDLQNFFIRISKLTGKGIYFLFDEFDAFLSAYSNSNKNNKQSLDNLFDAFMAMIEDTECRKSVHFVFCGSNRLLHFLKTGKKLQQFMQKLGDNIVETFYLSRNEFEDMLHMLPDKHKAISYTNEALDMIWTYSKGSAWFAKHLANASIKVALKDSRETIYPYDIFDGIDGAIGANACQHLDEALELDDFEIVYAISSLANETDKFVKLSAIRDVLPSGKRDYLETGIERLYNYGIIESDMIHPKEYRFKTEFHREFFKRKMPDDIKVLPEVETRFTRID